MDKYSFDDVCQLGTIQDVTDSVGDTEETIIYSADVFCHEKSIGYREIQAGAASGFRPDVVLIMPNDAYEQERYVKYRDERYKVVKTYRMEEDIELTLERG